MSKRGRYSPDDSQDKGRLLSAGYHNIMGYYRDDLPLIQLILDENGKKELGLNGTSLYSTELEYYATRGDSDNVQKIITEAAGRPDQFVITTAWGALLPQAGQFQMARTVLLRAADQAASAKKKDAQATALLARPAPAG